MIYSYLCDKADLIVIFFFFLLFCYFGVEKVKLTHCPQIHNPNKEIFPTQFDSQHFPCIQLNRLNVMSFCPSKQPEF